MVINLTIAALRQLAPPSLADIYYVTDSGQEGEWKCVSLGGALPSEDNTGTVIIGINGAKFTRIYSGAANAVWFKSGHDFTEAIQQAVNVAPEIYFPASKFLLLLAYSCNTTSFKNPFSWLSKH